MDEEYGFSLWLLDQKTDDPNLSCYINTSSIDSSYRSHNYTVGQMKGYLYSRGAGFEMIAALQELYLEWKVLMLNNHRKMMENMSEEERKGFEGENWCW